MGVEMVRRWIVFCDRCPDNALDYGALIATTAKAAETWARQAANFVVIDGEWVCPNCQEEASDGQTD